jgi:pilus assembly protein Flp/PilA
MHRFTELTSSIAGQATHLVRDQSGATAIEYALIAAGISVAIITAVSSVGSTTTAMYERVSTQLQ